MRLACLLFFFACALVSASAATENPALAAFNRSLQSSLQAGMATLPEVPPGWSGIVRIWVDEAGMVTKVSQSSKAGGAPIDTAALQKALARTPLPAPPKGLPMPVVLRIGGKKAPPTLAAYFREVEQTIIAGLRTLPDIPVMVDGSARLWIDAEGRVTRAEMANLKGLTINVAEVGQLLLRLRMPAPPANTPMPVTTQVKMEPGK